MVKTERRSFVRLFDGTRFLLSSFHLKEKLAAASNPTRVLPTTA